jgi:hypothetical protein
MLSCFQIPCFAFAVLVACAAQAADRQYAPVEGCVGKEVHICEQSFGRILRQAEAGGSVDEQLRSRPAAIRLSGFAPNVPGSFTLNADLGTGNRVTAVSIILPYLPSTLPTTETGFTKSGLYEGVTILLGTSCTPSRDVLFRLFEEKIRPTLTGRPDPSHGSDTYFEKAEPIALCQHTLTYSTLYGKDPYHLTPKAPPGSFVFPTITVE